MWIGSPIYEVTYSQGHIVQSNVEASRATGQVLPDQTGDVLTLSDQLAGVELGYHALQDFVDDRGQNSLVEVSTECAVDLRQGVDAGSRQNTAGDVDHLQILGAGQGSNVARLGADIVDDRSLEPRDTDMGTCGSPEMSDIAHFVVKGKAVPSA